ncbi:MAG TPA: META domain-containing protein [Pyrinomonadaceae bacterium]
MKQSIALLLAVLCCSIVMGQTNRNLATGQQALAGTEWRLVSLGRVGAETSIVSGGAVTLKFGADGRVSGSGGCNSFGGGYRVQGDRVTFSQMISTRRACVDTNANRQESQYLQALGSANRFRMTSRQLSIYYENGRSVLEFSNGSADSGDAGTLNDTDDPVSALIAYYRAIDAKDYRGAFRYWESPTQSLDQFTRGFSDTTSVRLLVDPSPEVEGAAGSSYASVATVVISKRTNGGDRIFAGCYTMRKSNLGPEDGQTRQGWRIYRADIQAVAAAARATSVLSQMCRE